MVEADEASASDKTSRASWGLLRDTLQGFRRTAGVLLRFDLVFAALQFTLLGPALGWMFRRMAAASGPALGNMDILRYACTAWGATTLAGCGVMTVTVFFARLAGIIWIADGALRGERRNWWHALQFTAARAPRIVGVSALALAALLVILLPFGLAAAFAARSLLGEHDINFYLESRPAEFWQAVGIGAGLAVAAALAVCAAAGSLLFLLPHLVIHPVSTRRAMLESRRIAAAVGTLTIVRTMCSWFAATLVMGLLANAVFYTTGHYVVSAVGDRIGLLLPVLGLLSAAGLILNYLLSFLTTSLVCLACVRLYRQAVPLHGAESTSNRGIPAAEQLELKWFPTRRAIVLGVMVLLTAGTAATYTLIDTIDLEVEVEISAHRGASIAAPENSLSAMRHAIEASADYLEVDVQLTADGVVVVNHDADLMRVGRSPLVISRSPLAELQAVEIGAGRSSEFAGERIPTLADVLDLAAGRAKVLIELKSYAGDAAALAAAVVNLVRERQFVSSVAVMSLEYREIQIVQQLAPEIECGLIVTVSLGNLSRLDVDFLAVAKSKATAALISTAHAAGKRVFVWTVDDPADMSKYIDRGADNLITNDPATAVELLKSRAAVGNPARLLLRFRSLYL